jgi:hypothetical protein
LNGPDVLQEGEIHSIVRRVALADDPSDFLRLPIDDAGRDQCQAAAGVLLFPEFAGFDSATPTIEHISGQGVKLFDFEQSAPDPITG